jgi:hypothetical protein
MILEDGTGRTPAAPTKAVRALNRIKIVAGPPSGTYLSVNFGVNRRGVPTLIGMLSY